MQNAELFSAHPYSPQKCCAVITFGVPTTSKIDIFAKNVEKKFGNTPPYDYICKKVFDTQLFPRLLMSKAWHKFYIK